ncbi:efflux RND transporter periplasmic adaptor subunit [Frigidibacter sp. MR17.14]|uniref:efflux RND transporter periplasmic adaptor subunit n=1 Tax=Frigidibacter sp. MR17.14 TaxID=3126509 RepID=UPI003012CF31
MTRLLPSLAIGLGLFAAPALAQQQMPPAPVSFIEIKPEPLPIVNDLPGRISATRLAEVRPQVSGIVEERVFEQGSAVHAGDVLYKIDPRPFQARLASAQGTLQRAQAAQQNARLDADRQAELRQRNVAAGTAYENAITTLAQADADVAVAQASLQEAQLNVDYTQVKAPIDGTIGRALITEGALVTAQTDVMATIQQLDPVYADFTQSSSQVLALRRALEAGQLSATAPGEAEVHLYYDDGTAYEHAGRLLFSEATVDSTTGQVTLRGEFPNPDGHLLPGLYVRVRIEQAVRQDAIAIPQMSVARDNQGGAQVYVIGADDTVAVRPVKLGSTLEDGRWVVEEGLAPGDRVVVEGLMKVYPQAKVVPSPYDPKAAAAAKPAADQPKN